LKAGKRRPLRSCVILSAVTLCCHVVMVAGTGEPVVMSIAMVALIAACCRCSLATWRQPTDASATSMLVVTALMLIAHSVLLGFGHTHGTNGSPIANGTSGALLSPAFSNALIFCVSAIEIVVVVQLASWLRRIHRTASTAA
jgi:hypothetical protein